MRGHIFFGDQVHAVVQRRDQADMRRTIEAGKRQLRKTLVEVADRKPVDLAMAAVDLADQRGKLGLKVAVGADIAARGHRNLQQRHRAFEMRLRLEQAVESAQSVGETF